MTQPPQRPVLFHRGRIQVEGRAGGGTVFRVEIPVDREAPAHS